MVDRWRLKIEWTSTMSWTTTNKSQDSQQKIKVEQMLVRKSLERLIAWCQLFQFPANVSHAPFTSTRDFWITFPTHDSAISGDH